jgi:hypothetical protein
MHFTNGYSLHGVSIDVPAYADELTFVSETLEGLQAMLDTAGRVATLAGLKFNPRKCATLHILSREVYETLGIQNGYHVAKSANKALKDKLQTKNDK